MARKPENNFRTSIHRLMTKGVPHQEKMNNPYRGGTWDDWYSGNKSDLWVEYKFLPRVPQRGGVKPCALLSALQLEWGQGRHAEGRNLAVIIGCPSGGVILSVPQLEQELSAEEFTSRISTRAELATWITQTTTR